MKKLTIMHLFSDEILNISASANIKGILACIKHQSEENEVPKIQFF